MRTSAWSQKGLQGRGDAINKMHDKFSQQKANFIELWGLKDGGAVRDGLNLVFQYFQDTVH